MTPETISVNLQRLQANRAYSSKLSWKRKETAELRRQIKEFLEVNFEIELPATKAQFTSLTWSNERFNEIAQDYGELINEYYILGNYGQSVGSLFTNAAGTQSEVFTNAHFYSKNRLDPVWNWKKSKLIRSVYYHFLKDTKIYEQYTPVHITLTLPHPGGLYNGKRFYLKELISNFNLIRKQDFWKKQVYAGEYGAEVSGSEKNGLHIHIHSLTFLKGQSINKFRDDLKKAWEGQTGASQIWVESLYIYKKDAAGRYIVELKERKNLQAHETPDNTTTKTPAGLVAVRKKYYLQDEIREINFNEYLNEEERGAAILELHTRAILETIKYHFKNDSLKLDAQNFNIFLINEILQNTKNKRLYSRFGAFYKCKELNFNKLDQAGDSEQLCEANNDTVINPYTLEETPITETDVVIFYPEKINYKGKKSREPDTPRRIDHTIFEHIEGRTIKEIMRDIIIQKFKKRCKTMRT
ncbi:MAG TPA: hypothetical protein PLB59_04170 [Bacteroidales bacterium]|nr:hypothetical protein [Bacteroidales bacterium]HPI29505.1 hypothetical protein [Bacteroidales bacterium]HQP15142.1 hypothetical protein [Bacteroidales bacterium]